MALTTIRDARRAQHEADPRTVPAGVARSQAFRSRIKAARSVGAGGKSRVTFDGYASVFEASYSMWDFWGEYREVVSVGAADKTLAANPDVAFLNNHRGMTMARTSNGTLTLEADTMGLHDVADCNLDRTDVSDLAAAVDDGDVTEQSFAFVITAGQWSPDYTEFRIDEFDIDRGDVSAVNFGANPFTSVSARAAEVMAALDHMPPGMARAAIERLQARAAVGTPDEPVMVRTAPAPGGRTLASALLELGR